jgi:hypothetical protein
MATDIRVSINNDDGTVQVHKDLIRNFAYSSGWRFESHTCFVADLRKTGRADSAQIAHGFLSITAVGNFSRPSLVVNNFGCNAEWRVDSHPRFLADATGDGFQKIIGFGSRSVLISFSNRDGTFQPPKSVPNTVATAQAIGAWGNTLAFLQI